MSEDGKRVWYDLYLSYSGRKSYDTCPKQYEFRYILKAPSDKDQSGSFFGSIIGKLFEWFYERRLWSAPDPVAATLDLSEAAMSEVFRKEKWDEATNPALCHQIRQDLRKYVPTTIDIIRKFSFLTPYTKAEVDLTVVYTSEKHGLTMKIGGRCDYVHSHDMRDVWILDGKASQHKDKYVDPEQLIWYAVQYYLKYRVAPTRLGFVFFRFPEDPVKWIAYDEEAMRASVTHTFDVAKRIHLKMFDPTPSDECKLCDYKNLCPEGSKYLSSQKVHERITDTLFDLEPV